MPTDPTLARAEGWWRVRRGPTEKWTCGVYIRDGSKYGWDGPAVVTLREQMDASKVEFGRYLDDIDTPDGTDQASQLLDLLGAMCSYIEHPQPWTDVDTLSEILGVPLLEDPTPASSGVCPDPKYLPDNFDPSYGPDSVDGWVRR